MPATTIYSWLKRDEIDFPSRVRNIKVSKYDVDTVGTKKEPKPTSPNNTKSSKLIISLKLERDYYKQQMEHFMGLYFKSCKK